VCNKRPNSHGYSKSTINEGLFSSGIEKSVTVVVFKADKNKQTNFTTVTKFGFLENPIGFCKWSEPFSSVFIKTNGFSSIFKTMVWFTNYHTSFSNFAVNIVKILLGTLLIKFNIKRSDMWAHKIKKLWHANTVKMLVRQSMQNIAVNLRGPDSVKGLDRPIAPVGGVKGWSIVLGRHGKLIRVWYRPESKPSQTNTATASVGFCVSPAAKSCETRKKITCGRSVGTHFTNPSWIAAACISNGSRRCGVCGLRWNRLKQLETDSHGSALTRSLGSRGRRDGFGREEPVRQGGGGMILNMGGATG
jgi:hypothetical protein